MLVVDVFVNMDENKRNKSLDNDSTEEHAQAAIGDLLLERIVVKMGMSPPTPTGDTVRPPRLRAEIG
eukprot:4173077-Amphidinium_carterae.1